MVLGYYVLVETTSKSIAMIFEELYCFSGFILISTRYRSSYFVLFYYVHTSDVLLVLMVTIVNFAHFFLFFYLLLSWPTVNFGPLAVREASLTGCCVWCLYNPGVTDSLARGLGPKARQMPSGLWTGILPILSVTP